MSLFKNIDRRGISSKTILSGGGVFTHRQNWDLIGKVLAMKARQRLIPLEDL